MSTETKKEDDFKFEIEPKKNEWKIDKGVPISRGRGRSSLKPDPKYPFKQMKKGDSFFIKKDLKLMDASATKAFQNLIYHNARKHKVRIATRVDGDKGIRVWKIGKLKPKKKQKK